MDLPFNLDPSAFAGAADDYVKYRPAYPAALIEYVRRVCGADGTGRLLDLGSGPGSVSLPLAKHFADVCAVDIAPDMVATGGREAERLGITNIRWNVARAEDFAAPAGAFDLVTMGQSFHRFDQPVVIPKLIAWLRPRGMVAAMGGIPAKPEERSPWQVVFDEVCARWRPPGAAPAHPNARQPAMTSGQILREAGFGDVQEIEDSGEFVVSQIWTVEALIGCAFSTSVMSRRALGENASSFAEEVRRTLLGINPRNEFPARQRFWCTTARRPY